MVFLKYFLSKVETLADKGVFSKGDDSIEVVLIYLHSNRIHCFS